MKSKVWYPLGFCFWMSPVGQNVFVTMTETQLGLLSPTRCHLRKLVLWQLPLRLFSPSLSLPLWAPQGSQVRATSSPSTWLVSEALHRLLHVNLTTEQIFLSPWHAVGLKCNSHSQMLPGSGRGAISCTHSRRGGGGLEQDENATGREPVLKLKREGLPASLSRVGRWRKRSPWKPEDFSTERSAGAWAASPGGPQALTLGVSFLERVAGVHKAGGGVVLVLELQMQLGCLAEGVSGSCNRKKVTLA